MATNQLDPALFEAPPARESGLQRSVRWLREHTLAIYAALALIYMFLPVAVVVLFSFNKPTGRTNTRWNEFSLDAWLNICQDPTICRSVGVSATIALFATVVGHDPGHDDLLRPGPPPVRGPRPRRTCSSSCRWPPPRSCSAPRCWPCS